MKGIYFKGFFFCIVIVCSCRTTWVKHSLGEHDALRKDTIGVTKNIEKAFYTFMRERNDELTAPGEPVVKGNISSNVRFVFTNDSTNYISNFDKSRCKATFKKDTLQIDIGFSDGQTGYGVIVKCFGNQFISQVSRFFHSSAAGQKILKFEIEKQTLLLNKSNYSLGDSIFGQIYVRQIDNAGMKYYAAGIFRTKVLKVEY